MKQPTKQFFSQRITEVLNLKSRRQKASQIIKILKYHFGAKQLRNFKVLDVGCSGGIISFALSKHVQELMGVDSDSYAIAFAKQHFQQKNLSFLEMDATALKFADNRFDLVICSQVYEDVKSPKKLFDQIHRVLKKGGSCYFSGENKYWIWENQYKLPLVSFLPITASRLLLKILGREEIFLLGTYRSYWELLQIFKKFKIDHYTPKIYQDPEQFGFTKLLAIKPLSNILPLAVWEFLEPISPNFIFILQKPSQK